MSRLTRAHWALIADSCGIATLALFALGTAMPHLRASAATAVISGVLIAGAATLVTVTALHSSLRLAAVIIGWTLFSAGWLTDARLRGGAWAESTWEWLALGALILTCSTIIVTHRMLADAAGGTQTAAERRRAEQLAWWAALLTRCGYANVHATDVRRTDRGQEVTLSLPRDGSVLLRTLQNSADSIAAALRALPGAVAFQQGVHAGEVILRADRGNSLADDLPFRPPPSQPGLSITDPLPIGMLPSGREATVAATVSTLVTGVTGSGKTNLLNVLIAQLTRCPDVVVFVIDLKGGRLAAPWILPWVEDRCPRPAVDWVATTRCEASKLLTAVDKLISARGASLAGGAAKVTPSPGLPQIVVITDEMADVTGDLPRGDWEGISPQDMAGLAAKATRKARSEAVALWWATQRGTIDFTGSSAIKSQCKQRLSLATASETDARSVTDNQAVVRLLAGAPWAGAVVIEAPGQRDAVLSKAWRLDGDADSALLDRLAQQAGRTRPEPDPAALAALGQEYATRWERSGLYQLLLGQFHARTGRAPLPEPPRTAPPDRAAGAVAALDVNQEAAALFAAAGLTGIKPDPEGRMWALLADRPSIGLSVIEITWALQREGLSAARSTIYRWLVRAESEGKVRRGSGDGDAGRWLLIG